MPLLRLLCLFLLTFSSAAASDNILQQAVDQFQSITSYSTTMHTYGESKQVIDYCYQKPGYVRMDFVTPHKGAVLIFRPDSGKVKLRPFGFIKSLTLSMEPTAKLVRSPSGHRIDESDIGVLLENAQKLVRQGSIEILREETLEGTATVVLQITGAEDKVASGVHRYVLWIDKQLKLPRKVESFDTNNRLIEGLSLENLVLNPDLTDYFAM